MGPYRIELPAVVAFSGGRTSGFMLWHVLNAHGGQPDDLKVCFQNTGLEHAATYAFVRECGRRWAVDITWLEYCVNAEGEHDVKVVDFDSASRNGEPFTALINKKELLPTPVNRVCSSNLKMRTMDRYLKTLPGFCDSYTNALGLRYDEPRRATRVKSDNGREEICCPMFDAGHTEADVLAWWRKQSFDLMLPFGTNVAGNCVGCFLKSRGKIEMLMEEMPEHFQWWIDAEESVRGIARVPVFRQDRPSYASLMDIVTSQGRLFSADDEDILPCLCTD